MTLFVEATYYNGNGRTRLAVRQRSAASSGGSMGLSSCLSMGTNKQGCLSDQQSVRFWYVQLVILEYYFAFTFYFDRPT